MRPEHDIAFTRTIAGLLEFLEGVFGTHPQWTFVRKVVLKRMNDLRRDVENEKERKGSAYESNERP